MRTFRIYSLSNFQNTMQQWWMLGASTGDPTHGKVMRRDLTGRRVRSQGVLCLSIVLYIESSVFTYLITWHLYLLTTITQSPHPKSVYKVLRLKTFSLRSGTTQACQLSRLLFNMALGSPRQNKQQKASELKRKM